VTMQVDRADIEMDAEPAVVPLGELVFALILVAVGIAILVIGETTIRTGTVSGDKLGPTAFPRVVGCLLVVCGGGVVIGTIRARLAGRPAVSLGGAEDEPGVSASAVRAFTIMGATMGYTAVMGPLGYLVATPLYLAATLLILKVRHKRMLFVVCVLMPIGLYYVFAQLLGVLLPAGILRPFLVQIGWAL
jgi:putative tricarboxylic transport membrane protein